jgi:hypothetical protein
MLRDGRAAILPLLPYESSMYKDWLESWFYGLVGYKLKLLLNTYAFFCRCCK